MKKNLNILFLFLFIASCGGYNKSKDFRFKESSLIGNDNSVVIIGLRETKFTHTGALIDPPSQGIGQMEWCNIETKKCFFINPHDSRIGIQMFQILFLGALGGTMLAHGTGTYDTMNESYLIFQIQSGMYYLQSLSLTSTDVQVNGKWNNKTQEASLASFEVKPNEALYIGDISINVCYFLYKPNTARFMVHDNFETATLYTLSKFPQIKPEQIEKRLMIIGENAKEDKCKI